MNRSFPIVIVAPITSSPRDLPTRIPLELDGRQGEIALEQIRAIDRQRILGKVGHLKPAVADRVCDALGAMFRK
jgi:mRNA interferase MazF